MKNSILKLILASSLLVFISCNNNRKAHNKPIESSKNSLIAFSDKFLEENPNYFNNDVTITKYDSIFAVTALENFRLKGIDSIPLTLTGIKKVRNKYYAHFSIWKGRYENTDYDITFDFVSNIDKRSIDTLIQGEKYMVRFSPFSFVKSIPLLKEISDKHYNTPTVGLRRSDYGTKPKEIELGIMLGAIENIRKP